MNWDSLLRLDAATNPNGGTSNAYYDGAGRPTLRKLPDGQQVSWGYAGNVTTETGPRGWTRTTVNGFGQTVKVERGYDSTTKSVMDYEYEPCSCAPFGKLKRESLRRQASDATKVWTTRTYDILGRVTQIQHASGGATVYQYDINPGTGRRTVRITPPDQRWKKYHVDGWGDLRTVDEPKPDNGALSEATNYTYDEEHRLLTVSMARSGYKNSAAGTYTQTRSFEYDGAGRITKTTVPEKTGAAETHYDAQGRVSWKLDNRGRKTVYEYDSNARLQYVKRYLTASSAEDTAERTEYIYDGLTLLFKQGLNPPAVDFVQENGLRRVVGIRSGPAVVELMAYTDGGQLKRKRVIAEGQSLEVSYSYGTDGKVQSITYPSGRVLKYGYGAWGRPTSLQAGDGYQYASASFGWHERTANLNYGPQSTSWEGFEYNRLGQMTRWWSIPGRHITYDYEWPGGYNNGKLESQTDALQNRTVTYNYDLLGRIGSAVSTSGWVQTFQFDGFGNLYRKNSAGGAPFGDWTALLNSEKNQITAGPGFDEAGNEKWHNDVRYDYENRMRESPGGGMGWKASYEYSADNKRVVKRKTAFPLSSPQDTYEVTLWANGQRVAVRTGGGVWTLQEYVGFAGRRFSWTSVTAPPALEQADRVGSTVETLPFGEEMSATANDWTKFATYWRDSVTGLDYADQRYYAPGLGRFMTADPYQASAGVEDPASWNRYAYVLGDPVNGSDPSGLKTTWLGGAMYETCVEVGGVEGSMPQYRCFSWGNSGVEGLGDRPVITTAQWQTLVDEAMQATQTARKICEGDADKVRNDMLEPVDGALLNRTEKAWEDFNNNLRTVGITVGVTTLMVAAAAFTDGLGAPTLAAFLEAASINIRSIQAGAIIGVGVALTQAYGTIRSVESEWRERNPGQSLSDAYRVTGSARKLHERAVNGCTMSHRDQWNHFTNVVGRSFYIVPTY